ncbi:MAG: phytanoyl-CoA dioxygenase [Gemmatimonadetes bacterium]|nr:phytanoyl-CoA dioxygenase [Gemmatimonadota bacterium]
MTAIQPFLDSNDIISDGAELARRMDRDGYLVVRGLLDPDRIFALRQKFLAIAYNAGWLLKDSPLNEATADLSRFCVEPEDPYMEIIRRMNQIEQFHAVQHDPALVDLLERMCGEPILPHPRVITRAIFPRRDAFTTPPHQDFIPIQGTPDTFTAWFPLGDLPAPMGGVEIAKGSHTGGLYEFQPGLGAGGIEITESFEGRWRGGPFAAGDVLFFHSMAVHRGVPNKTDSLRLSVDARYQKISEPIAPGSLLPHTKPQTWEEIYADWPADSPYRDYWSAFDLQVEEYDDSYHGKRDDMALEMAAQGDARSRSGLQRIIARDPDPAKREQAQTLLDGLPTT